MSESIHSFDIDLSTAGTKTLEAPGFIIQASDANDLEAEIEVSASGSSKKETGDFPIKVTGKLVLQKPFQRVKVKWAAQPGKTIRVDLVNLEDPPQEFEYVYGGGSIIEGIAKAVKIAGALTWTTLEPVNIDNTSVTDAVEIFPVNTDRREAVFTNKHATATLYWGGSNVTVANGQELAPGESWVHDNADAIYGVFDGVQGDVKRGEGTN